MYLNSNIFHSKLEKIEMSEGSEVSEFEESCSTSENVKEIADSGNGTRKYKSYVDAQFERFLYLILTF